MEWKKHFSNIYGDETAKQWIPLLQERIEKTAAVLKSRRQVDREQNVILITYPDQIYGEEPCLELFSKFAEQYLEGIFDVIHFLPFCPYSSDDGFSVLDYYRLAERLGSWEDLLKLSEIYTLMYDFVCNHVSAGSEWFRKCLAGDEQYENYFIEVDPKADLSSVIRPRTTPLYHRFPTAKGEKCYWTTFSEDQIDLNYANPRVLYDAIDVFLNYLEKGADWIRLDAVGFLWKEIGTSCMHHEKTHEFVRLLRSIMEKVCPSGRIITETNVLHEENISYFGNGLNESHMVYQFPLPLLVLYSFYSRNADILSKWVGSLRLPSDRTSFFNFLASHDGIGINPVRGLIAEEEINSLIRHLQEKSGALISYKENADGSCSAYEINVSYFSALQEDFDFETALCRFLNAHAVLLGMQGDCAVYINSYLGTLNDRESVEKTGINRAINRKKFLYEQLNRSLADSDSREKRVCLAMENLIRIRKSSDAFDAHAPQEVLRLEKELFAYMRKGKTQTVLCLHNFSDHAVKTVFFKGTDMLTGKREEEQITVEPFDFKWIVSDNRNESRLL